MIILSHKIQIKNPTVKQEQYFRQACGTSRFAYNWGLEEWKKQYELGLKPTAFQIKKSFNAIKLLEFPWVFNVTKCAAEQAFINLGTAFNRLFNGRGKYPRFKKKGQHDSFYLSNDQFKITENQFKIPKLGWVSVTETLRFSGKILSATVSRAANKWFVSIQVQMETTAIKVSENQADTVGVDLGIKNLATLSNGETTEGSKPLKKLSRRLARIQRHTQKCTKGSKRYNRQKMKIARLHYRICCIRQDGLHKLTHRLCQDFKIICLEDLNVKGMMKNHKLAKAISDMGFYEFKRQLEYKSSLFGNWISSVDRWFPSSKTCSNCGNKKEELKLSERVYHCGKCGFKIDRDLNAAINIEREGIRLLA
ncbi:RNA-guided endonuclease InsQ/TnpB family protein [Candidatus Marithrix sp. Canyon 246]|uniref:RNA-guided endonuclease InsQ/TnpB family protein n=3 Tax=Candidatus Marithrix sp. Canyon 246 TaxID=1827136 RepID=UPI000A9203ED|nr:RNA-guided endonuclease TnpB family protein [Candidatus Marithrix sp. Canyon 246]